jgi:hypothetical protein
MAYGKKGKQGKGIKDKGRKEKSETVSSATDDLFASAEGNPRADELPVAHLM